MFTVGYLRGLRAMQKSITAILKSHLKEYGMSQARLAEKLGQTPQNFSQLLKNNSLNSDLLMRISKILKRDLFSDLSGMLREEMAAEGVSEPSVPYGKITYQSLLEENVQLNRELRTVKQQLAQMSGNVKAMSNSHTDTIA